MVDHEFRPEIEVLSAADVSRRRHWSDADKIRTVEENFLGHRQVTATARRHGVWRSLLTVWRRQYRDGELGVDRMVVIDEDVVEHSNVHLQQVACYLFGRTVQSACG